MYDDSRKCEYPYAEFYLAGGQRLLSPGHVYTITVQLDLPESSANADIGYISDQYAHVLLFVL